MGAFLSRQREVDELRKDVFKKFDGQKILLIGTLGSGKSSLVNSINYVLNLENPNAHYHEVAELSDSEAYHGTPVYRMYTPEKDLYHEVKDQNLLEDVSSAPTLFDISGVDEQLLDGDQLDLKKFLLCVFQGKVEEFTDIIKIFNTPEELEKVAIQEAADDRRPWSVVCVVSLAAVFPTKFYENVAKALRETKANQGGDTLNLAEKKQKVQSYSERCKTTLNMSEGRIFEVTNYTSKQWGKGNQRMDKDTEKERKILFFLNRIFLSCYKPRWT
ncbi:uncharacterized protein LOC134183200 isoform X2 [Corticium candelabrum]|uniref:uncharacterized protein LOC134183200 isoform X2 n=1 Tax=Corticium candelabrum TaxID=121492 RepID=UPI002E267E20|nr:uncharacterized protein LOC134183200 isoform X2 [Corticium candelabrum]